MSCDMYLLYQLLRFRSCVSTTCKHVPAASRHRSAGWCSTSMYHWNWRRGSAEVEEEKQYCDFVCSLQKEKVLGKGINSVVHNETSSPEFIASQVEKKGKAPQSIPQPTTKSASSNPSITILPKAPPRPRSKIKYKDSLVQCCSHPDSFQNLDTPRAKSCR